VATALYANGIRIFGRNEIPRPAAFITDGECSNTLMEVDGIPNVQAETTFLASARQSSHRMSRVAPSST
jgi:sarcosine oxidase subunit alpha